MKKAILNVIPWVLVGVLLTLLITPKACPGKPGHLQETLKKELEPMKAEIAATGKKVEDLLSGQKNLADSQKEVLKKLPAIQTSVAKLEKQLSTRPAPENPNDFKSLPECQAKYTTLKESYQICMDLDKSREEQLNLFNQVNQNLTSQTDLLTKAIDELNDQVKGYAGIEKTITASMEKLDRAYKKGRLLRDVKYLTIGLGVGIGAAVLTTTVIVILKAIKK